MSTLPKQTTRSETGGESSLNPPPPASAATVVQALRQLLAQPSQARSDAIQYELTAPLSVPGYEVLGELGRGGMARVFRARQIRLGRVVALKVILAGPHAGPEQLARFQNEAEAAARLQHPNIVQIYEVGEHEGLPYLALEFVEGGSLADRLGGAPLPAPAAAELVEVLARAVDAAHARGVVHRDLKPANVLLTTDGVPKVSDFGLAKQLDTDTAQTRTGVILGTPSYMAPEQAEGRAHEVGPPADVYALGAILYECVTGRPPFRSPSVLETLEQVRSRDPVPPRQLQPGLARDLQTVCLKCLEKDPKKRYLSARALAEDLARLRAGEPIHARPVGPVELLLKWVRRRPALATLGSFSVLAVLGLIVGGLVYQTRLVAALHRAEENENRAGAGYRNARAAMQRMLARLGERNLAEVPQLLELRRQQYEDALAFYREVLAYQDNSDPAVRFDVAVAYRETAILQHLLGRDGPAEENYRQAAAVLERLRAEQPAFPEYAGHLAATYHNLAALLPLPARKDESEQLFQKALALREELCRLDPDAPDLQENLAQTYHTLGALYLSTGRDPMAHFEKAMELRDPLVRDHPDNATYAGHAAETRTSLGLCHLYRGRLDQAEEDFRKAEALLVPLAHDHPEKPDYAASLCALHVNWALLLQKAKRPAEALAMYDKAVAGLEAVLRREPNLTQVRDYLLNAHGGRAQALAGLGRFGDAVSSWDRVLELSEKHPGRDLFRLEAALNLARAGQHARAAAEADEYAKRVKIPPEWLYHLACVYARASETAGTDEGQLKEEYAVKALKLLTRARDAGYFSTPERVALLRGDAHLAPVRKRSDYEQLQGEIEKGREPG